MENILTFRDGEKASNVKWREIGMTGTESGIQALRGTYQAEEAASRVDDFLLVGGHH